MEYRIVFALSVWQRLRGLIGRDPSWLGEGSALLIAPCNSIHTFWMHYPIDVAFVDRRGEVLDAARCVPPRRLLNCPGAWATLERPASDGAAAWFSKGDLAVLGRMTCLGGIHKSEY